MTIQITNELDGNKFWVKIYWKKKRGNFFSYFKDADIFPFMVAISPFLFIYWLFHKKLYLIKEFRNYPIDYKVNFKIRPTK